MGWVDNTTPRPLYPREETQFLFYRCLRGPHGQTRWVRIISPPPRFDPRTVQPVACRYTNLAIPVHKTKCFVLKFVMLLVQLPSCIFTFGRKYKNDVLIQKVIK